MMQNHSILPSPARLGVTNPNSPSLSSNPSTPKIPSSSTTTSSQPYLQHQNQPPTTLTTTSPTLLSLLPPLSRAQSILLHMASLATKLFDLSPNRAVWLSSFRGSAPSFLPSQTLIPPFDPPPSSIKEILSLSTSLQTQLFESVAELQEILDLQDSKLKIAHEIRSKDAAILTFAKKIKEAQQVLDLLVDDYADYRRPKRPKSTPQSPSSSTSSSSSTTLTSPELNLSDILSHAHRISYTTFAPPEFGAGQAPLRGSLPPAPQEEQMRASQLYNFVDLDVGLPKTKETNEKTLDTLMESALPQPGETPPMIQGVVIPPSIKVPSGWRPGMPVELPSDLPLVPPPGWKPGDPVSLPPLDALAGLPNKGEEQRPAINQMPGAPLAPKAPEPIQVRFVQLDINPDQDEYSSDYSSEVGSSEEDEE
ncbi:hydroxyproline-rich glycoprotein family protein [Tasmannia lanceolata]|uniref:hydroxyproline-rich glycoprotein family protein n=1 Tax=Tasmannia lanceolata TaxID=3420 RepID=UPI0040637337